MQMSSPYALALVSDSKWHLGVDLLPCKQNYLFTHTLKTGHKLEQDINSTFNVSIYCICQYMKIEKCFFCKINFIVKTN